MTTCERSRGFTLLEVIIVLAVLGVLLGTAVPLVSASVDADRRQEARAELAALGEALESHYFASGAFPASLSSPGFVGVHLQAGVGGTATIDPFGAGQPYVYSVDEVAGVATAYSRGENGSDEGADGEELVVRVDCAVPGMRRTWQRLHIAVELIAGHIEAGGNVTGNWTSLRHVLGLGDAYDTDGFGVPLRWEPNSFELTSAGPDRTFDTPDDITI